MSATERSHKMWRHARDFADMYISSQLRYVEQYLAQPLALFCIHMVQPLHTDVVLDWRVWFRMSLNLAVDLLMLL